MTHPVPQLTAPEPLRSPWQRLLDYLRDLLPHDPEPTVILETFPNRILAEMTQELLAAEGIDSLIEADDAGGAYPMLQFVHGVRLLVRPEDATPARELLNSLAEPPHPPDPTG